MGNTKIVKITVAQCIEDENNGNLHSTVYTASNFA